MKNSYSRCRKVEKALLHCRNLYCATEGFTAQQEALLHYRKFYYTIEGFTT